MKTIREIKELEWLGFKLTRSGHSATLEINPLKFYATKRGPNTVEFGSIDENRNQTVIEKDILGMDANEIIGTIIHFYWRNGRDEGVKQVRNAVLIRIERALGL